MYVFFYTIEQFKVSLFLICKRYRIAQKLFLLCFFNFKFSTLIIYKKWSKSSNPLLIIHRICLLNIEFDCSKNYLYTYIVLLTCLSFVMVINISRTQFSSDKRSLNCPSRKKRYSIDRYNYSRIKFDSFLIERLEVAEMLASRNPIQRQWLIDNRDN